MNLPPIEIDHAGLSVPPLLEVAQDVLELLRSGEGTAADVVKLVARDPAFASLTLGVVNSPYYALPTTIADTRQAVAYLGLEEVERSVIIAAVLNFSGPARSLSHRQFWLHAFHTALVARRIARNHIKGLDTGEVQAAALLHDLGKLVYLGFFPEHARAVEELRRQTQQRAVDAERALALPSHLLLGSIAAERWGLPASIRAACAAHELEDLDAPAQRPDDASAVTTVANLLSNLTLESLAEELRCALRAAVMRRLEFDDRRFLLLMGEVYALKGEAEGLVAGL